ncbi:MAG: methylmalonate-semialdehyde dehydrogenase (CoA acylating) [Cellvibrionales bacterium TMED148]|nr:methylmalonate-semialdehyde dehydrogenase (CoA acylating) [Porticoccaceae bacterium]RPG93383.1 MAG: methylmalonate-semialdehyde dehydrogenase (CoA acylating) [Cellvibrionales bacterium TMED148]
MRIVTHFINGEDDQTSSGSSDLFNPSTGSKIGEVLHASSAEIDCAVQAAINALPLWSQTGLYHRSKLFLEARQLYMAKRDELIDFCVNEAGKTRSDAAAEVDKSAEILAHGASVPSWLKTDISHNISPGIDTYESRQPIGVVGAVSPFNFPVLIPMLQTVMAIACGNTVIAKPSEKVPSSFRLIVEKVFNKAGFPRGVVNLVNGGRETVTAMMDHPRISGVTFVGSTPVARELRSIGFGKNKKVQAFGSGKNHLLVLPDADLDMVADAAVSAAFGAAGQRCMAVSVLVVVGNIADELVLRISQRIPEIRVGKTDGADVQLGPVISRESRDRIHSFIDGAERSGARLVVDGRPHSEGDGWFVGATLIDQVKPGMPVYDNEIFGPVLSIVRTDSYEHAMKIISGHPLGNGSAIFTSDGGAAKRFADDVGAGMIGINVPIPLPSWGHSIGGLKDSAFAESKASGPEAVNFYTHVRAITARWPDPADSRVDLGFLKT